MLGYTKLVTFLYGWISQTLIDAASKAIRSCQERALVIFSVAEYPGEVLVHSRRLIDIN